MRIGIDITPVIYQGSGIGTYTRQLVRHLIPLDSKIHYVLFASTLRSKKTILEFVDTLKLHPNFSFKVFPLPPTITELTWNKLHTLPIEKLIGAVDVFHAWDWQQPPAKKARLITTIHDLTTLKFPQHQHPKTIKVHRRRLQWVVKEASAIIADSEATKADIQELLKVQKSKIHTIYLAASSDFSLFENQKLEAKLNEINKVRRKYHLKNEYILTVGTREPRKNLKRVIKAYKLLSPKLDLVIAGKFGWGENKSKIKNQKSKIHILGYVDQANLPALYAGAKVLVYPSLYEGFGLPVLEAMSLGVPVVTSSQGSLKEVAGQAAVLVNPEKSVDISAGIETALGDKSHTLVKKGLKQARKFSWKKTAQKTLSIYKSLITNN